MNRSKFVESVESHDRWMKRQRRIDKTIATVQWLIVIVVIGWLGWMAWLIGNK